MSRDETPFAAGPKAVACTPFHWLAAVALSFGALLLLMRLGYGGPGTALMVLPWFVPVISLFQTLIHLSVSFVALGRYKVLNSQPCLWIGLGSAGFGVSLMYYALTWPGLLPGGGGLVGTLPGTPAWPLQIGITIFSSFLLAAALSRRTLISSDYTSLLATSWSILLALCLALLIRFEHNLPPLVSNDGLFTPPLLVWNAAVALFFTAGALCSTLRFRKEGDPVVGYIAFTQMAYAFAIFATVTGMRRYDLWWYLLRLILTGSGLVLLFGLLREYLVLLKSERTQAAELLRVEEKLRENEKKQLASLQSIVDRTGSSIAVLQGKDLVYTLVNPAFQSIAPGISMVGRRFREVFPEAAAAGTEAGYLRVLETGEQWLVEAYHAPVPGKPDAMWQGHVVRLPSEPGAEPSVLAAIWDITDRVRAEQALLQANEELEERVRQRTEEVTRALRNLQSETEERLRAVQELQEKERMLIQQSRLAAMGEMISNIAHQWRQPLNALGLILQNLSLMRKRGVLSDELLERSVQQAKELIQHMSGTIDDFRNFFNADKEKTAFHPATAVENAVRLVEPSFKSHQIAIMVEVAEDAAVNGYPNEYAQAILNILTNAREAIERGRAADPRVSITVSRQDDKSVVTISDNAGGIPQEILPKIFDPHFTTKGPHGTGIGLFMAKTIVEKNMDGRLSARNTADGAEFILEV